MLIVNGMVKDAQIESPQKAVKPVVYSFLLIFSIAFALFGFFKFINTYSPGGVLSTSAFKKVLEGEVVESTESSSAQAVPVGNAFEDLIKPLYYSPERLIIENLGINAQVIPVTTEDGGYLETPKDWYQIGWYKRGALAGEDGNLLLNGHYDTNTGALAAFGELKNIELGDKVVVEDRLGRTFTYSVLEKYYLDINDPDRTKVFDSTSNKKEITLITCGGVWLSGQGTYNQRLIVRGELDEIDE
jgi:LPXTG-site transpeptidase (sortase) family protein